MKQENEQQKLEFSRRLRLSMSKRNIKAVELSNMTGIDKGAISNYVKGKYMPKNDKIYLLAHALEVNPTWLSSIELRLDPTEGLEEISAPIRLSSNPGIDTDEKIDIMLEGMLKLSHDDRKKLLNMARVMFPGTFPDEEP